MKSKILFLVLVSILLAGGVSHAREDQEIYSAALENAKSGNREFAFMYFRSILTKYPDSKYTQDALFAVGEYYFLLADYDDAFEAFGRYTRDYPHSQETPFVLIYLFKMAKIKGKDSLAGKLEKAIVTFRRLSLLFRNSRDYKYRSPLFRKHRVVYYIDKVEFYVDEELFAKISY